MRSLLDDIEEEETTAREITLSTASLLGVFFGLVLICGVFFGFGYSLGRGTEQGAQAASLGTGPGASAAQADETTAAANQPPPSPPAAPSEDDTDAPAKAAPPVIVKQAKPDVAQDTTGEDAAPPKHVSQALVAAIQSEAPPMQPKPSARIAPPATVAATAAPSAAPAPAPGKPMVQIAAVARQEDADVLVSALRQRGYGVVVRSEPQDKLLHVQVGPFADRSQATAIKQKLLSDGYNAIIKQ
jgi:DedD protein